MRLFGFGRSENEEKLCENNGEKAKKVLFGLFNSSFFAVRLGGDGRIESKTWWCFFKKEGMKSVSENLRYGQQFIDKSLSMKSTFDNQKAINRIASILLKHSPNNWKQAHFCCKTPAGNSNQWDSFFLVGNEQDVDLIQIPFEINEEIIENLDILSNSVKFHCSMSKIILHSNKKYEIKYKHSEIERLDIITIESEIKKLREINVINSDIDEVKKTISKLTRGYSISSPIIGPEKKFYRGVRCKEKPTHCTSISYPPKDKVRNYHRAGRPGQPLFYCSTDRNAVCYELDVEIGDWIVISEWETRDQLLVNNVGYCSDALRKLGTKRTLPRWGREAISSNTEIHDEIIGNFFSEEFTKIVPSGQEQLYKISIAIAEQHFEHSLFDGLLYPAVAFKGNADNLCIKPISVDEKMVLRRVEFVYITDSSNEGYKVQILDFANSFTVDGKIVWKGRLPHWILRKKGGWREMQMVMSLSRSNIEE